MGRREGPILRLICLAGRWFAIAFTLLQQLIFVETGFKNIWIVIFGHKLESLELFYFEKIYIRPLHLPSPSQAIQQGDLD